MTNIKEIWLFETSIGELPFSFQNLSELVSSKVEYLNLGKNNLSEECLTIVLTRFANVKYLYLWNNNFKILPKCLDECHLIRILELDGCKSLEEIRGIPPNLEKFSAIRCESLTFSCRRMLLSQKLPGAGCTEICLPTETEDIPDWFEHKIEGHTIFHVARRLPPLGKFLRQKMCSITNSISVFYYQDLALG
ncbi:unnamed protein product [Vicia faba]|uniref:Disease resistance protein n=1 Tax=Vicia faba TaxID=3906 RepID=A0AAV0ZBB2_VICFA|nr:unnamed protein product [Vicia faba]